MTNWHYYNQNGEKIGPISVSALKELTRQGLITRETIIENQDGRSSAAGKVNGLTFPETIPVPPPIIQTTNAGYTPPPPQPGFAQDWQQALQQHGMGGQQPQNGGILYWYLEVLKKYATFSGRARRRELISFLLIQCPINVFLLCISGFLSVVAESSESAAVGLFAGAFGLLVALYSLAMSLPLLALYVRRLHDLGRSGLFLLLIFIPFVGPILVLAIFVSMLFRDGQPGENKYGPNPKGSNHAH